MLHQGSNKEVSGSVKKVLKKDTVNVHKSNNKQDSSCVRDSVPKVRRGGLKIPIVNLPIVGDANNGGDATGGEEQSGNNLNSSPGNTPKVTPAS